MQQAEGAYADQPPPGECDVINAAAGIVAFCPCSAEGGRGSLAGWALSHRVVDALGDFTGLLFSEKPRSLSKGQAPVCGISDLFRLVFMRPWRLAPWTRSAMRINSSRGSALQICPPGGVADGRDRVGVSPEKACRSGVGIAQVSEHIY